MVFNYNNSGHVPSLGGGVFNTPSNCIHLSSNWLFDVQPIKLIRCMYSINTSASFNDLSNILSVTTPICIPTSMGGIITEVDRRWIREIDIVKVLMKGVESSGRTVSITENSHLSFSEAISISRQKITMKRTMYLDA